MRVASLATVLAVLAAYLMLRVQQPSLDDRPHIELGLSKRAGALATLCEAPHVVGCKEEC